MNALLLVAHGSRREQSNEEVRELAKTLHARCGDRFPVIHAGFLELAVNIGGEDEESLSHTLPPV